MFSAILRYLILGEVSSWPRGGHFTVSVQAYTYTYSVLAPKKKKKKKKRKKKKPCKENVAAAILRLTTSWLLSPYFFFPLPV